MDQSLETPSEQQKASSWSRAGQWFRRIYRWSCNVVAFYLGIAVVGLIPVNVGFEQPPVGEGVEITIHSNPVHSDIILPIKNSLIDWREHFPAEHFPRETDWCTHIAFGWGDAGFYVDTPTWGDMTVGTTVNALLIPSETVVHVAMTRSDLIDDKRGRTFRISDEQYQQLVDFVLSSFQQDEQGKKCWIEEGSYGVADTFYRGRGRYHGLNTCNCWTGRALKKSGVTVGWFTPLPKSIFVYLPAEE